MMFSHSFFSELAGNLATGPIPILNTNPDPATKKADPLQNRIRSPVNLDYFLAQNRYRYPKLFQARLCLNILSFLNQEFYLSKLCRQEAWLEGGQEAMDKIEPFIRDQRLDAIFVDDY
jgi:hypothetical protein